MQNASQLKLAMYLRIDFISILFTTTMLFQIQAYLRFLWQSKNEHAVHSPFVFNLLTKCFYDTKNRAAYDVFKKYRQQQLNNKNTLNITDFGAGSRVFTSNNRIISKIAKTAGISQKRGKLLVRLVEYFDPKTILELGTSLGIATSAMSSDTKNNNKTTKIITLEGCTETANYARTQLQECEFKNIEVVATEFGDYFKQLPPQNFDFIYFDGNHSKTATLEYFELLLPTAHNDSVWIFDDIHWSKGMEQAWEQIQQHPKVSVTIDTFQWGFVFFRREQPKEHFIIRV
jgi:predicted O-methyltransferase YrrM